MPWHLLGSPSVGTSWIITGWLRKLVLIVRLIYTHTCTHICTQPLLSVDFVRPHGSDLKSEGGTFIPQPKPGLEPMHTHIPKYKCTRRPVSLRYILLYPLHNEDVGRILVSPRPSICRSVRPSVRSSRILCPLCTAYSSGWIHFKYYTSYKATS